MSKVFRAFPALKAMGDNVRNYILSSLFVSNKNESVISPLLDNWVKPELAGNENTLIGPLVLEGGFGYEKSNCTLESLSKDADNANDCTLHPVLYSMLKEKHLKSSESNEDTKRKPYVHQEAAFRAAKTKSIIVSAGTGSGKTECFLYPIISEILRESPEQRRVRGIRAFILYPTNALIHSQEERLAEYLNTTANRNCNGRPISFCLYNAGLSASDTPSSFYRVMNRKDLYDTENGTPDIVLTNFSMLEYMLLREKDALILQKEQLIKEKEHFEVLIREYKKSKDEAILQMEACLKKNGELVLANQTYRDSIYSHEENEKKMAQKLAEYKNLILSMNLRNQVFHVKKVGLISHSEMDIIFGKYKSDVYIMRIDEKNSSDIINILDVESVSQNDKKKNKVDIIYMLKSKKYNISVLVNELIVDQFIEAYKNFYSESMKLQNKIHL